MSDRLKALREKRATINVNMREILKKAEKEMRDATKEEIAKNTALVLRPSSLVLLKEEFE